MPYTLSIFSNLKKQYPTWNDLYTKFFLEMYGNLRLITFPGNDRYVIIRYEKGKSDFSVPEVPYFRSVVWDTQQNIPVCIAPMKSNAFNESVDINTVKGPATVEEYIEGTMINVFQAENDQPQMATRTKLGGNTKFYSSKTFEELFNEALTNENLSLNELNAQFICPSSPDLKIKSVFGSLILRHPEHRVVQKNTTTSLNLVYYGFVEEDGNVLIFDEKDDWNSPILKRMAIPQYQVLNDSETVMERVNTLSHQKPAFWQGLMFRRIGGFEPEQRIRIRTFSYITIRNLRGSEALPEGRFCRLRRQGFIQNYLYNYPEETNMMTLLENRFRAITFMIYKEYCAVYKEKSKSLSEVDVNLRSILWNLHGIYLNTCRPMHKTMKMPMVISYINNMAVEEQETLLKYYKL